MSEEKVCVGVGCDIKGRNGAITSCSINRQKRGKAQLQNRLLCEAKRHVIKRQILKQKENSGRCEAGMYGCM